MQIQHQERNGGKEKGFTLIELLIVIGIIGFLAAAILVAVDPVKRIQDARNARRYAEVNAILNAILNKQVDDRALYTGVTGALIIPSATRAQVIVKSHTTPTAVVCNAPATTPAACALPAGFTLNTTAANTACVANLSDLAPSYIADIPVDPGTSVNLSAGLPLGDNNSGYYIIETTTGNRITIGSCYAEQSAVIKVQR